MYDESANGSEGSIAGSNRSSGCVFYWCEALRNSLSRMIFDVLLTACFFLAFVHTFAFKRFANSTLSTSRFGTATVQFRHSMFIFSQPQRGPLFLGHSSHFSLGLFDFGSRVMRPWKR